MLFTKAAKVMAWLMVVFGIWFIGMGFTIAIQEPAANRAALAARYLGNKSSGEAIDLGIYLFFLGVLVGVFCEISKNVANRKSQEIS